jgi:metal-dependent amidase/aminoacylase/carboxypeptidase family protein
MSDLKARVKQLASEFAAETITIRQHIHANPELSFQEYQTSEFVKEKLKSYGLEAENMADTGLVVLLKGQNPEKKTIALRADLDALPIFEKNEVAYKSRNEGVMHA